MSPVSAARPDAASAAGENIPSIKTLPIRSTNSDVAAAAAARINAQIQAKRGIQHVDVPPIQKVACRSPVHGGVVHN